MRLSTAGFVPQATEEFAGEQRCLNSELWHACAGPLVSLPTIGSHVVYFPQGHSEQVAASTNREVDAQIPKYPSLPPQLICQLHNLTMHADVETDEVYAQMTLQPLSLQEQKDPYLTADLGAPNKQPTNYFCKTLTASDTSTHGGFSVPRRAAEKVFPPLDFSKQPPAQELIARDLHDNEWKFRHIFRGQPKRHLLTTGWSVFVSAKRLVAGDSVLFIWNEKNQLLLGVRHAGRSQTVMPSSVLSSDSMHLGLLAAAAHAAATNSRFTVFYNPRQCPSEFVIPLSKYVKAAYHTRVSVGMRFRMLFETEESSVRRYMGTITGIGDLDHVRWMNSHWRSVKVGWDESTAGERQPRVSLWEIEPLTTFPMYPSPFPFRLKRPWPLGPPSLHGMKDNEMGMNSPFMWLREDNCGDHALNYPMMHSSRFDSSMAGHQNDMNHQDQQFFLQQQLQHFQSYNSNTNTQMPLVDQLQYTTPLRSLGHQQSFSDSSAVTSPRVSPLHTLYEDSLNLPQTNLINSSSWMPLEETNVPHISPSLPPFPGRECSVEQEGSGDPHVLFGVNLDPSSLLLQNGLAGLGREGADSLHMPFTSNYMSAMGSDILFNPAITAPSSCLDDSSFLPSPENMGQFNPPKRTFVKVHKSGSFGRSLDITKFKSYRELRSELGRMFAFEDQLDDTSRSGWQLVFEDRENDILLLGDGPWPEFVNSVSCIRILSPLEVQEMGNGGLELLSPDSFRHRRISM